MVWVFCILCCCLAASAEILVNPEPNSVLLGGNATFSCAGNNTPLTLLIAWTVDGVSTVDLDIQSTNIVVGGVRMSNLTITGTVENNNASIQCQLVVLGSAPIPSTQVFLTVLGIGQVPILELINATHTRHPCIQWEEPVFVSTDVKDLMYNVSVGEADLPPLTITTNETQYCLELTPCQEYNITVTPFSPSLGYVGTSNKTTATFEGDNYYLKEERCMLSDVEFVDINHATCFFACQVAVPKIPCPHQSLRMNITAETKDTKSGVRPINSTAYSGGSETSIVIKAPVLPAERKYHANFSITDVNGDVVDTVNTTLPFSTYKVQNATFLHPPDSSVVSITCRFATGAFASACMAYFENTSLGLYFNGSVPYNPTSPVSSRNVSIPQEVFELGLSRVLFDAEIFDVDMNGNIQKKPALEQKEALKIELDNAEPSADTSTHATGASTSAIPSVASTEVPSSWTIVVVVSVVLLLAVAGFVPLLLCYIRWYMYKRKAKSVTFLCQGCAPQIAESSLGAPRSHSSANDGGVVVSEVTSFTTNAENTQYHVHEEGVHPQDSNGVYENVPDINHPNIVGSGEKMPHTFHSPSPSANYSSELAEKNGDPVLHAERGARPGNAKHVLPPETRVPHMDVNVKRAPKDIASISSSPKVNGKEGEHAEIKKQNVVYAELGAKPYTAPPILPPETNVLYMTVKPTCTTNDKDSNGVHESATNANHPNIVGSGEKLPHILHSPTPSANYSSEVCEKEFELVEKKTNLVVYAELGARPGNVTPDLPPETRVPYTDVSVKRTPENKASITSSPKADGKEGELVGTKKPNVVYAKLGAKPYTAPPVLPPETPVLYTNVKPVAKDKNSFASWSASKFPSYVDEQSQEREVGASSFELWELQPEVENNEDGLTKGVPAFNRDASIVTFRRGVSSVRDASTAVHNLSEMVIADPFIPKPKVFEDKSANQNTDGENEAPCPNAITPAVVANIPKPKIFNVTSVSPNTDAENEAVCLVLSGCFLPSFALKSKVVHGICFEVNENDAPAMAPESKVEDSSCKESGELMIAVEADYCHQEKPSSTDPCQGDDCEVVNELMVGKKPSSENNHNPLPYHRAQGNQKSCCSAPSYSWFFFFYYCP